MSQSAWYSVLDDVHSGLLTMRPDDILSAASRLSELRDIQPDPEVLVKLNQVRAAALNAARLWKVFLPDSDVLYSPAGESRALEAPDGISVTA